MAVSQGPRNDLGRRTKLILLFLHIDPQPNSLQMRDSNRFMGKGENAQERFIASTKFLRTIRI